MSRQPKPGEWWFSPDGTERAFYVGVDGDGVPLWEIERNEFTDQIPPSFIPVPDCTGWGWQLPALPNGWGLCNPPKDAVECTFLRVWDDDAWNWCHSDYINAVEYIYCRRVKSAEQEPQYRPFANAEEFWPFRNCWWRTKGKLEAYPPARFDDEFYGGSSWADCFRVLAILEDIDGKMVARPFGWEVTHD